MKRLRLHPLLALFAVLCLLGAQQAAYAHALSHLPGKPIAAQAKGGHGDEGAAADACVACAAYAALAAAPPVFVVPLATAQAAAGRIVHACIAAAPAPAALPYSSRAPPVVP